MMIYVIGYLLCGALSVLLINCWVYYKRSHGEYEAPTTLGDALRITIFWPVIILVFILTIP